MFVGACRDGRAYLRVRAPDRDRPGRCNEPAKTRSSRMPSTDNTVTTATDGSEPKMSVADTGIVPGDPSGNPTTKNSTPPLRLNPDAAKSRPNNGCTGEVTRTSHGNNRRRCCSLSLSRQAPGNPT